MMKLIADSIGRNLARVVVAAAYGFGASVGAASGLLLMVGDVPF